MPVQSRHAPEDLAFLLLAASHGGRSGRFERLKETAEEYAFLLRQITAF